VHGLNASDEDSSTSEGLEPEHRSGDPFDCPVVLLNDVIQVFALAQQDTNAGISLDTFNGCCVCATRD
jgi:hypothetical protein